jgi:hypothetical protein
LCVPGVAAAQARAIPAFDLEQLTLNPGAREGIVAGTADLLGEREVRAALALHYEHDPLLYSQDGAVAGAVVRNRLTAHLLAGYGIKRWLEVGLQLPVVIYQEGAALDAVQTPAHAALGTAWLHGRFGLFSQAERGPPIDLALQLMLGVPLGGGAALASDNMVSAVLDAQVGRNFGPVRAGAELGVLVRRAQALSPDSAVVSDQVGTALTLAAQVSTTRPGLRGELTLVGRVPFTQEPASVELLLGGRYPLGPIELFAELGPGFGRTPGTPAFRALIGVGRTLSIGSGTAAPEVKP